MHRVCPCISHGAHDSDGSLSAWKLYSMIVNILSHVGILATASCVECWLLLHLSKSSCCCCACRPASQCGNWSPLYWLQRPGHFRRQQPAQVRAAHQRQSESGRLVPRPQRASPTPSCYDVSHSIRHSMFTGAVLCQSIGLAGLAAVKDFCWFHKQKSDRVFLMCLLCKLLRLERGASTVVVCTCPHAC